MNMNFTLDFGNLSKEMQAIFDATHEEFVGAIYEEMENVKVKSQAIVPYRFGALKASADVVGVNVVNYSKNSGAVVIGYGGAASAYSVIQHETPPPGGSDGEGVRTFTHAAGKTWKYLENPMMEAIPGMEARIVARMSARLASR